MRGLLIILFLLPLQAIPQEPSLYFEKITVQNGLSHNKVNCMLQDRKGFIWIGTEDGLNRFDGKHFLHFRHNPSDTSSLPGNIISDLLEDRQGRIWIATTDGGLGRYDYRLPSTQQFKQYKIKGADPRSLPVKAINTLLMDDKGYLWLGTSGRSVIRFHMDSEKFEAISQSTSTILDLIKDNGDMIWVGREGGGILKIDPQTLQSKEDPRYRNFYAKLPHVTVTAFHKDQLGNIWFGSWDEVLYKWNVQNGEEEVFKANGPYSFQKDEVLCFAEDANGNLWIGGKTKGLHLYDKKNHRFYNAQYNPSREGSLSDNRVNCMFRDRQGRMWIGTNRGINISNPQQQQFSQQFISGKNKDLVVFDFHEADDGSIWMGTSDGLYIRKQDGSLIHRPLQFKGHPLQVTSFYQDRNKSFYLGTNYSLFQYDPVNHAISLLPNTEKDSVMNQIIESRVVSIVKDQMNGKEVLYAVPYGHFLAYYDFASRRWVSRLHGSNMIKQFNLKDNLIRKLYKTSNGGIWMATVKEGLVKWTKNSLPQASYLAHDPANPQSISSNHVYDMVEDNKGNLWVSTYGGGLHYFDMKKNSFRRIAASNNLVEGIQLDHRQRVWMVSNGQLHRYDPSLETHKSYHLPDIEKTGGVNGKMFKDSKGWLYVAGRNYYISFHPDSIRDDQSVLQPQLTGFHIFDQSFSHLLQKPGIVLNYKDNYFTFEFAAPDYTSGSTVRYSYMLEGFDRDWVDAGERNYVSYSNLEGGNYTFKVRATNTPGVWSEKFASIQLSVIPPFWKQTWFYFALIAVLLLASYSIYRYRINELLKRQAIRNRIAQDLHDNVGSTLSSISVYSQVARIYHQREKEKELDSTLEKISSASSDMISELNDTVWAINPRNDQMQVILGRMESFARPLLAAQSIEFRFNYDNRIRSLYLEMEKRKNFYLIFKEAIHNVIKYAACSRVTVSIRQKGNHVFMLMEDNGKGFDLSKTSEGYKSSDAFGGGNGLRNMQRRAAEMKGQLKISSRMGEGTRVELEFPIT